jgi:CHASE2 domain-containing sensor protein
MKTRIQGLKQFLLVFRRWPAALALACVFAVDLFDSFGLDQAADEQAARIVGTVSAPFYGDNERTGQGAITVVLIDDASLEFLNWPTPVPYDQQADLVSAIAAMEPAAIFLDFSYLRPHGEDPGTQIKALSERLRGQQEFGGPPIMIGEVGADAIFDPLRELTSVGVSWRDSSWLNYPLQDSEGRPMAASALYQAWCAAHDGACAQGWSPLRSPPAQPRRLSLTWGFGGSPEAAQLNGRALDHECVLPNTGFGARAGASLRQSFGALARAAFNAKSVQDSAEARCIYTDTLNAAMLLRGDNDEAILPLVRGRLVLVGASHRQSADLQAIPHVGVVPGVFVHAMATDNLIEHGPNFHRPPPDGIWALDLADMVEMALSVGLFLMAALLLGKGTLGSVRESEGTPSRVRRMLVVGALGVGFVLLVAVIEYSLHWPPLNVLGVVVLVSAVFSYLQRQEIPFSNTKVSGS